MRNLFILRGVPGSGKSTWVKENELDSYTISADTLRLMYQSPVTNIDGTHTISQNHDSEVWKMVLNLMERRMQNGELIIVDATHYKSTLINKYKDLISKYRYRVYVVDFSGISEEELKKRNKERGFRAVPEEVIDKMLVAIKDTSEVKKAYPIITPDEASALINSELRPYIIPENINKVVIFGDIHGCYDPLKYYFDKNPFNDNTNYIFCGDYLDRGIQNKEVLEFLISIKGKKNCVFLEGNHEAWLRQYASKDYNIEDYIAKKPFTYSDPFVSEIRVQLIDIQDELALQAWKAETTIDNLNKLLKEARVMDPNATEVYYEFELVNVHEALLKLQAEATEARVKKSRIKGLISDLQHEEYNTKQYINHIQEWCKSNVDKELSLDVSKILEGYGVSQKKQENPIKSTEFLTNTYPQIKDIDKTEIRRFCDRLAQMSYFDFKGNRFLVTHGGVPCMPTMKTQSIELIKGVGKYEDHETVDIMFVKNQTGKSRIRSAHGHRNIMRAPITDDACDTFNLEGQVEHGGCLRIVEIGGAGSEMYVHSIEIKNNTYKKEESTDTVAEEKSDVEILKEMYHSEWVQVKNLKDNIISLNFTREAFVKSIWDSITCHARGLFVDKTNGNVVAKSFNKFFNYNQVTETTLPVLKRTFKFPVVGYKKENGFLGIISKYNGKVRFFTKSSDGGDYVNWFIGALCNNYGICKPDNVTYTDIYNKEPYNQEENSIKEVTLKALRERLEARLQPYIKEGYSYVFECVDPANDPHIIKYDSSRVYLLEVFKNQLKEETVSYDDLKSIADRLSVPCKSLELTFNTWEEFEAWKDKFGRDGTQWDCKHEGYVLEDSNGFRVKFKSYFYTFWKQMRGLKDALASGKGNKKAYRTKEEIQVCKLLESHTREELKNMSIIDIEDEFYYGKA